MLSNHDIDLLVENSTYRISKVLCVILNLTHLIYLSRIDQRSLMFYPASQIASQDFCLSVGWSVGLSQKNGMSQNFLREIVSHKRLNKSQRRAPISILIFPAHLNSAKISQKEFREIFVFLQLV